MADLQELFSRLRTSAASNGLSSPPSNAGPQPPTNYQPPSVSSPIFSPPTHTPDPTGSAILSPHVPIPVPDAKAANLLNLLRFNGKTPSQPSPLAALQNVGTKTTGPPIGGTADGAAPSVPKDATAANAQNFLLNLLNQPSKASNGDATPKKPEARSEAESKARVSSVFDSLDQRDVTPVRVFGSKESRETTPFNIPQSGKTSGMFTYVNPFESLSASTPRSGTPKASANGPKTERSHGRTPATESDDARPAKKAHKAEAEPVIKKEESDDVPESWQNVKAAPESATVQVYNFPMRPFAAIRLLDGHSAIGIRADSVMDIVRLKKDFDQIDRTLVTASQSHIVYAMSKSGGFRIIRQDSGRDKQVFKSSQERIFHVQIKAAVDGSGSEAILATGVGGSVFWTKLDIFEDEKFQVEDLETSGFVLLPINTQDENTSGSPVKTRSKMSSRHLDIFAISRGKAIHIISPSIATSSSYIDAKSRVVDATKYFQDRNIRISTGKACKDFAFSQDDSVIASLDKAGRIRFWDIKELSDAARGPKRASIELKTSILSFAPTTASEKISPTSIMFVDKERPCVKGVALRYLLVGFKQNHSLQLWDLSLGKPVQELNFPHEKDSDAICSISYHPKTGIIAVGHPTRNSIYFIHLSAPRYHIPNMDQAKYMTMLASEDAHLPKPDSTAIMTGIRELSFSSKGQLRSLDMLVDPATPAGDVEKIEEVLFELYAMHSTGVTCLSIKRADLGWQSDNKVIKPVDAEQAGFVTMTPLAASGDSSSESSDAPRKMSTVEKTLNGASAKILAKPVKATSPQPKGAVVESVELRAQDIPVSKTRDLVTPFSYAAAAARPASMFLPEAVISVEDPQTARLTSLVDRTRSGSTPKGDQGVADGSIAAFSNSLSKELESLYRRIEGDRRVQDAAANARQDAILKLVSSTLTDNVEKSLGNIVSSSIQNEVLPTVSDVFVSVVEGRLTQALRESIGQTHAQELRAGLDEAVKSALNDQDYLQSMHRSLSSEVSRHVLDTMEGVVRKTIAPTISQTISTAVQNALADSQAKTASQRLEQDNKIDRLANLMFDLSANLQRMNATQTALQDQVSALQRQLSGNGASLETRGASPSVSVQAAEDPELEEVTNLMTERRFEDGTIKGELFDKLFVRINPQYLQTLSPLVKLSVSAAVSTSFDQNVDKRLDWLGIILASTDLHDSDIASVAPKIMQVLLGRIQGAFMAFAESNPSDPVLRKFSNLSRQITDISHALR